MVAADNVALAGNVVVEDNAAMETMPLEEDVPPVTGKREKQFPWGVLGLIGLVGLLGRRSR
jgi:MYXO-CTERM domain-containing protein